MKKLILFFLFTAFTLTADEKSPPSVDVKEELIETSHKVTIEGHEVPYKAVAGILPLKNKEDKVHAAMFFVSYLKDGVEDKRTRPITFCFNGGPGSSSVWLHMGVFGPKRVNLADTTAAPPYSLVDNLYSLLDLTDLVFIDPVSTGFSKAAPGEDPKQFHGVDEDVQSIAEFIRQWTSKYQRWDSPKYIAGESYGTTRAAALALKLHDDEFYYLNGVILISSVLNFQTISDPQDGNDLPYILLLPSYTATAWYHKKLTPDLQQDLNQAMKESSAFALNEYGPALLKGDLLSLEERKELLQKMARLTGLSETFLDRSHLRVGVGRFAKELLRDEVRTVGRFDSRFLGIDGDPSGCSYEYDPSLEAVAGAYCALFNQYVLSELKWDKTDPYRLLTDVSPWNWGKNSNSYLNVGDKLREVMSKNPHLRIFVASGFYDLATPSLATEYTFNHLNLPPILKKNISLRTYEAGHMMYIFEPALIKMKRDLTEFYKR